MGWTKPYELLIMMAKEISNNRKRIRRLENANNNTVYTGVDNSSEDIHIHKQAHKPLQIEGRTIPTFPDIIKEILSIVIITTAFVGFLLYTNDVDFDTIEVVALYAQPIVWLGIYINIKNMFGKQDQ
jgi:hypothetical protein